MIINKDLPYFNVLTKKQLQVLLAHIDELEKLKDIDEDIIDLIGSVMPIIDQFNFKNKTELSDKIDDIIYHEEYLNDLLDARDDFQIQKLKDETSELEAKYKEAKMKAELAEKAKEDFENYVRKSELFD